jgi:lantibiotic modifying enzyme
MRPPPSGDHTVGRGRHLASLALVAACLIAVSVAPHAQRPRSLVDDARGVAAWLRATAIPVGEARAWAKTPGSNARPDATLYSGTPGVVLFFLELHRATGDAAALADARAGADWLLARVDAEPQAGLYTGLAGIGFTLTEVWKVTKDPRYRAGASRVVDRLKTMARPPGEGAEGVEWSASSDIISGTAGIGLYLLSAARELGRPDATDLAAAAGRRLLGQSIAAAGGEKWAPNPAAPARLYPNFSHGTGGVAYFLATLHQATRDRRFLDGALGGARYLLKVAKTDGDVCLIFHHEPEPDGLDLYYLGWCHGPAGTARLFHRLREITGDREWQEWVRKSARGIQTSGIPESRTPGFWNNVGMCCGSASVAEFFLSYHQTTGDRDAVGFARKLTDEILAKATRDAQGTRWIHAENRVSPNDLTAQTGWMQGASGIGAWLLRLDAFDRGAVPVVTLPDSPFAWTPR